MWKSFAVLLFALAACSGDSFSPGALELRTDSSEYVALPGPRVSDVRTYELIIVARFTNGTTRTVFVERCFAETEYPTYFVELTSGSEAAAYDPDWACPAGASFVVEPDETLEVVVPLVAPHVFVQGQPVGVFAGQFRLGFNWWSCPDESEQCADRAGGATRSNEFTIAVPQ
jgi:hypothetical protein